MISDTDFSSYANDNTTYDCGNSTDDVISSLKESSEILFQLFIIKWKEIQTNAIWLLAPINHL